MQSLTRHVSNVRQGCMGVSRAIFVEPSGCPPLAIPPEQETRHATAATVGPSHLFCFGLDCKTRNTILSGWKAARGIAHFRHGGESDESFMSAWPVLFHKPMSHAHAEKQCECEVAEVAQRLKTTSFRHLLIKRNIPRHSCTYLESQSIG